MAVNRPAQRLRERQRRSETREPSDLRVVHAIGGHRRGGAAASKGQPRSVAIQLPRVRSIAEPQTRGASKLTECKYQSGEYLASNPDWHAEDAPFKAQWIANILERNAVAPDHIVEVGSGSGEILVQLQKYLPSAELAGYDVSPQAHAIAAPKASNGLKFHHADYLALDTPPPDLLMAIDVFEHVEDYMAFLRSIRTRAPLKLFHIPLDLSVQGMIRGTPIMRGRRVLGHLHYFYKDTALASLADCGYQIVDWNYTHGSELLPNRFLRTRMLKAPRRILRKIDQDFAVRLMGGASMMVLAR
jgi:hypothetical protein